MFRRDIKEETTMLPDLALDFRQASELEGVNFEYIMVIFGTWENFNGLSSM